MPALKNAKEELFAQEYVRTRNATESALWAGYDTTEDNARGLGWQIRHKPKVSARIRELSNKQYKRNTAKIDELISILSDIARANLTDIFDQDGNVRPLDEIPDHAKHAISEISTRAHYIGGEFAGVTHKIKMSGKQDAIDKLLRIMGAYEADNRQKKPDPVILQFNPLANLDELPGPGDPLQLPESQTDDE